MPEYMTKSEPVDKKPYIVYTDEKGILYSGDPDSDIPGGGGDATEYDIKCYDETGEPSESIAYSATLEYGNDGWFFNVDTSSTISKAVPGTFFAIDMSSYTEKFPFVVNTEQDIHNPDFKEFPEITDGDYKVVTMPAQDVFVYIAAWS